MAAAKTKRRRKGQKRVVDFTTWQWDASTPEQRANRKWRMSDRGETDPTTGKKRNPNNIQGVDYLTPVEEYASQGLIEMHHLDAAHRYEELRRATRGSPSQRSCLDMSPVGHDDGDINPRHEAEMRAILDALGIHERAELDRTVWGNEPTARLELLRRALDKVADVLGC